MGGLGLLREVGPGAGTLRYDRHVGERAYRVLVVEDQIDRDDAEAQIDADRRAGEPYLELVGLARSQGDAIQHLDELGYMPDVIIIDDYLAEEEGTSSRSFELMREIHVRSHGLDPVDWPRCVLWTACDPQVVYTFCVLGGLQFQDKRWTDGQKLPLAAAWRALAGERWWPDPHPEGLGKARAALPYVEAALTDAQIAQQRGMTASTAGSLHEAARKLPGGEALANRHAMIPFLKAKGWVWVPFAMHGRIPGTVDLPLVIDPALRRDGLPPAGPLPAGISRQG